MDKTIQLLLVITVVMVTALIVIMMVTGQTDQFEGFLNSQSKSAKCDLAIERHASACDCSGNSQDQGGSGRSGKWSTERSYKIYQNNKNCAIPTCKKVCK